MPSGYCDAVLGHVWATAIGPQRCRLANKRWRLPTAMLSGTTDTVSTAERFLTEAHADVQRKQLEKRMQYER
jgi:hypothetical protein